MATSSCRSWDATTGTLRSIAVYDGADYPLGIFPIVVTPDGTGLWIGSNRQARSHPLVRLDVATGEETEVDSHPTFSVDPGRPVWPTLPVAAHPQPADRRTARGALSR